MGPAVKSSLPGSEHNLRWPGRREGLIAHVLTGLSEREARAKRAWRVPGVFSGIMRNLDKYTWQGRVRKTPAGTSFVVC
jgi:hypothetical protein